MTETKKLDIFDVLANADSRNSDFLSGLEPEVAKQFSPLVVMRWFSAVDNRSQYRDYVVQVTNQIINRDFWSLKDHPELQWRLMAACGVGTKLRHGWIPMPKRRKVTKLDEFLLQYFPSANDEELNILKSVSKDEFEEFARSAGLPDKEYEEVINSYCVENGIEAEKPRKKAKKKT